MTDAGMARNNGESLRVLPPSGSSFETTPRELQMKAENAKKSEAAAAARLECAR